MTVPRIHIRRRLAFMRLSQILSVFDGDHSIAIWPAPGGFRVAIGDDPPIRFAATALQAAALARRLLRKIA